MTFVLEARRLGKLLVIDASGHGESLAVVVIFLMRLGFSFEDAELIMQRYVEDVHWRGVMVQVVLQA